MNQISFQDRAIELLSKYRYAPRMYATDKEAFVCMVTSVLQFIKIEKGLRDFHKKHWGTYGNTYLNLDKPFDDAWAHAVIDDAIQLIIKYDIIM